VEFIENSMIEELKERGMKFKLQALKEMGGKRGG
jgi:hypothetical protein